MNEMPKTGRGWRILRRTLIGLAMLATLIAMFYTEEDWRGKRAWENCKRELQAKGETLDWNALIPPPVPDDQNFFKAPGMTKWFVKMTNTPPQPYTSEFAGLSTNKLNGTTITNVSDARSYLQWSDQFRPQLDQVREALKRPYARIDCDYSDPAYIQIPNFIAARSLAQVLARRTESYLLLGQPDKALDELTFLDDSRRIMEGAPTGKPMTLVAAMINVAVTGLYADVIAEGMQSHAWQEPQLAAIQQQLEGINLPPMVRESLHDGEQVGSSCWLQTASAAELFKMLVGTLPAQKKTVSWLQTIEKMKWELMPQGWRYQNSVLMTMQIENWADGLDLTNNLISPHKIDMTTKVLSADLNHVGPYNFIAAMAIPNFSRAYMVTAHNQTMVNEAQIACALERYRLANDAYPETLDALVPQFVEKLPHDIIGGQPLIYHPTDNGKFLLYSVGWNEMDDGGKSGGTDFTKGDWVWKN
jgi:hypothetical protein